MQREKARRYNSVGIEINTAERPRDSCLKRSERKRERDSERELGREKGRERERVMEEERKSDKECE